MRKGDRTKASILTRAIDLASVSGLEGLTIGSLSKHVGMSKSGLFAHFGSKEALQVGVVMAIRSRFEQEVIAPALLEPRGLPRIRNLFDRWVRWTGGTEFQGGCLLIASASEFDDRPGAVREALVENTVQLREFLVGAVARAVAEGHFTAETNPEQLAFEFHALILGFHFERRFLCSENSDQRVRSAFESLLKTHSGVQHD